ncbi:MAG: hypothetical protein J3Q66DRAFT_358504 [Benniella sp.]|nr:MAG: hypothetical protein J3Q66DRAFT_358504 [Benniella sp.]
MDPGSASVATTPPPSIFNVPELAGLIGQFLSSHDIAQCMATCKAWTPLFEPLLWQVVELNTICPAPQALARNRHRIHSLSVASNDLVNLCTLAADLPDITPFSTPGNSSLAGPDQSREPYNSNSSTTGSSVFQNLRIIRVDYDSEDVAYDWNERKLCRDYVLRILNQSPGLLQLAPPENFLGKGFPNHTESFLYALAHKLPSVKKLYIRREVVTVETGLELLRVCLNHPQLVDLHCDFSIAGTLDFFTDQDIQLFNSFSTIMENDKRARKGTGEPALESPIKALVLPRTNGRYPPEFICTLLRSYLPNLERFHIPDIGGDRHTSYMASFKEAVAQGCPKLQHLRCSWFEDDEDIHDVLNGIIEGCGFIKSFYCENFDDLTENEDSRCIMETLLDNHHDTLEEVELVNCRKVHSNDLAGLFWCRNLKKAKILQSGIGDAVLEFQNVEFRCHDLKELHLTLSRPRVDPEQDEFGSDEEDYDENEDLDSRLERFEAWVRRWAKEAYTQIGSLSKLEILSLDCDDRMDAASPMDNYDYDLTLDHGWLRELAGLKELRHFHMATNFYSKMGQAEVEFIHAQWLKLERITFSCGNLEAIIGKPHWQWLQERRPRLVYDHFF